MNRKKILNIILVFSFVSIYSCGRDGVEMRIKASNEIRSIEGFIQTAGTKESNKDFKGAIIDLNKAIQIVDKYNMQKSDFNIGDDLYEELNKFAKRIYMLRGLDNYALSNTDDAISDFTNAIALQPNNKDAYYLRGNCYYAKGIGLDEAGTIYSTNKNNACTDWEKAKNLGDNDAITVIKKYCSR